MVSWCRPTGIPGVPLLHKLVFRYQLRQGGDLTRGLMGPARTSPGPGPATPRPRYGHRVWAEDLDDEAHTVLNWDSDKERAATGELPIGPRPPRL